MRRLKSFYLTFLLVSALIIFGGCSFLNFDNASDELPKKTINLKIDSDYRNTVVSSYTITATKSGDEVIENTASTTASLSLTYGEWNISVVGKNSSAIVVCDGSKTITVDSGTNDVVIGVAYKTGGIKCNYSYDIVNIVSKIKITATRSGYTTISNQISVDTASLSGSIYLFDALPGSWTVLTEAMNAESAVYYSKSFTATVAESDLFTNSSVLDQKIATAPVFSVAGNTYTTDQTISLSTTTSGASIYYTTDGVTTPTAGSTLYTTPISVAGSGTNMTIKAITIKSGLTNSSVVTNAYTINYDNCATPTFSPNSGTFTSATNVTITSTTAGATIHYTTNGDTPTTSSASITNGSTISLSSNGTYTVKAIAVKSGYDNSSVGSSGTITINISLPDCAAPTFSPNSGTFTSATDVTITSATTGATIHYTTDGTTPTTGSPSISNGSTISLATNGTYTVKAIAVKSGYNNSSVGVSGSIVINIVTTTIRVHIDVGSGNNIYIRGSQSPLSWISGALATWTTGNIWVWTTTELSGSFTFKALFNDVVYESGSDHTGTAGDTIDIYLTRFTINKDAGGSQMYVQGDTSPLSWTEAVGILATHTGSNQWEALVSGLSGTFLYKWRCGSTWEGGSNKSGTACITNSSSWQ